MPHSIQIQVGQLDRYTADKDEQNKQNNNSPLELMLEYMVIRL